jgi:hypothetical protein
MVQDLKLSYQDTDGNLRLYNVESQFSARAWRLSVFNPLAYYEDARGVGAMVKSVVQFVILVLFLAILGTAAVNAGQWYGVLFIISVIVRLIINVTVYNPLHIWFRRSRLTSYTGPQVSTDDVVLPVFNQFVYDTYARWIDWLPILLQKNKLIRILYVLWFMAFFIIAILMIVLGIPGDAGSKFLWLIVPFVDMIMLSTRMFNGAPTRDATPFDITGLHTVTKTVSSSSTVGNTTTTTTVTTTYSNVRVYRLIDVKKGTPMPMAPVQQQMTTLPPTAPAPVQEGAVAVDVPPTEQAGNPPPPNTAAGPYASP